MQIDEGRLRDFLIDSGLMTRGQLADIGVSGEEGDSLYTLLSRRSIIAEDELRRAAAHATGTQFVVLTREDISPEAIMLIPEPISRLHNLVAYSVNGSELEVALLDLDDLAHLAALNLQYKVRPRLTTRESIKHGAHLLSKDIEGEVRRHAQSGAHVVDALLHHALLSSANGIHVDLAATTLVRYRIGAALREAMQLPAHIGSALAEQLKALAKLFPTAASVQEGRFKFEKDGEMYIVHVSALPTEGGERLILRLARGSQGSNGFALASLGLHGLALENTHSLLNQGSGLLVVAGPEKSGKTTTLYTLLDQLNHQRLSIATIEEKIEHRFAHIAQTTTKPEVGVSTAAGLRAILRQDPDVVMVGDLRDADTLALALHAASVGVLVLAGVEARSPSDAIERLRDLGASPAQLASALKGVIGVDVVKKLCPFDKEEYRLSRAEAAPLEAAPEDGGAGADFGRVLASLKEERIVDSGLPWKELLFAHAISCPHCTDGYQGAVGLQEVLPISGMSKELLREGAPADEIEAEIRKDGALTIIEDGLFKAAQGLTSIEEVFKLT